MDNPRWQEMLAWAQRELRQMPRGRPRWPVGLFVKGPGLKDGFLLFSSNHTLPVMRDLARQLERRFPGIRTDVEDNPD
jgi:hypothetical protein